MGNLARFDIFENPTGKDYVLELQNDTLTDLNTTITAPIVEKSKHQNTLGVLNPVIKINDDDFVIRIELQSAIKRNRLSKPIGNASEYSYEISRALDMLFYGI